MVFVYVLIGSPFGPLLMHFLNPVLSVIMSVNFNDSIPKRDWIDLNFQMINTSRQTSFKVQNRSVYKVGNIILSNRLACICKKVPLNMLNFDIGPFKVTCKNMLLK